MHRGGHFSPDSPLPDQACFAYLDFDPYRGTIDALRAVDARSVPGTTIVVDDYGFLSAGVQEAVDEFVGERGAEWSFRPPPSYLELRFTATRPASSLLPG